MEWIEQPSHWACPPIQPPVSYLEVLVAVLWGLGL